MDIFTKKEDATKNANPGEENTGGHGFGGFSAKKNAQATISPNDIAKDMSELTRRIRINEERSLNLRKKTQMIEHNMLINHKKILGEVKYINEEIFDLKRQFEDIRGGMRSISHELEKVAKKEDVQVLERYINMWEPVNFVTRKEVERVIRDILREK